MNLGFLHVKITSVSQGNLIWWWRRGLLHKLPRLYMCSTVSWGLGNHFSVAACTKRILDLVPEHSSK